MSFKKRITIGFLIVCGVSFLLLSACQNESREKNRNELLPTRVNVYTEVNFLEQNIDSWLEGVDAVFLKALNNQVLQSNTPIFEAMPVYVSKPTIVQDKAYIKTLVEESTLGISSLYFVENWSFSNSTQQLEKHIDSWSPVLQYYKINKERDIADTNIVKTLLYNVDCSDSEADKLIAKSIFYEQKVEAEESLNEYLDVEKLADLIVTPVLRGNKKVFDFFENTPLTVADICENWGVELSEEDFQTEDFKSQIDLESITAYIFEEDWYINPKTFAIRKEIKSISPVYSGFRTDQDGELYEFKRILFKQKY